MAPITARRTGWIDIRTRRRIDRRWECQCRLVSADGCCSRWAGDSKQEGYSSRDQAFAAGLALGQSLVARYAPKESPVEETEGGPTASE